jgi:hypothetical protein
MSGSTLCKFFNLMLPCQLQAMPLPPLTDFVALLGIALVLCAIGSRLLNARHCGAGWAKWGLTAFFVILWFPVGAAHLPVVAYVRGISSDLSVTLVVLACIGLCQHWFGTHAISRQETTALNAVVAAIAVFLYPLALGWGDWDAYRAGWGSIGMLAGLLALSLGFWVRGLRLLPVLVGLALLAWSAGLMESTNLWDYLVDPWLAMAALVQSVKAGAQNWRHRFGQDALSIRSSPPPP